MAIASHNWPSALSGVWARHSREADVGDNPVMVEGTLGLIGALYDHDEALGEMARTFVGHATDLNRPGWSASGRAIWALALWRGGDEDSALLQLILAELDLQEELLAPRPEPAGGPTGAGAASNNMGVAYSALRMFELAQPHLRRAAAISSAGYGPTLSLQICADLANLAEIGVRWALYSRAVTSGENSAFLAARAGIDATCMKQYARQLGNDGGVRLATALEIGARSLTHPDRLSMADRDEMLDILSQPVFGDEPSEVLVRAIAARVCRKAGDAQGCREQADLVARMNLRAYHASTVIALREAAMLEGPETRTWTFARAVADEAEATRRRTVSGFRARLAVAGLQHRYEAMSKEHRQLQVALQDALQQEAELVHAATHDGLTGLPNRALFDQRLTSALQGERPRHLAVAYVDLDDFKQINDTYGHAAGDTVLRWTGQHLLSVTGASDTVARLGGDEFAVLLVDAASPEQVHAWRDSAMDVLHGPSRPYAVNASVGVYLVRAGDTSVEDVLHKADGAMYLAKRRAKGSAG